MQECRSCVLLLPIFNPSLGWREKLPQKVGRKEKLAEKVGRREIYPPVPPPSKQSRGAIHSTKIPTGPTGKSGPPQKADPFFRNFSGWIEEIHLVLDRNFRKFWLNESRPRYYGKFSSWKRFIMWSVLQIFTQRKRVLRSSWILNERNLSCKIMKNCRIIGLNRARRNNFCLRTVW